MSLGRWFTLGALLAFTGCDVGLALLMTKDDGGSSDDGPALVSPVIPGPEFTVAVASLADDNAGTAAYNQLMNTNGSLGPAWRTVGTGMSTTVFDPVVNPASINTVLIKATSLQNFRLDSLEILDAQGQVVEHASGTVWSNAVSSWPDLLGTPDGAVAVTTAVDGENAFIFTRYAGPIDRIRVNAYADDASPGPGDVQAVGSFVSAYNERPGGLAIDANGRINLTLTVNDTVRLARYGLDAAFLDDVEIEKDIKVSFGSHAVAVAVNGEIYTASTIYDGKVLVQQNHTDLSKGWSRQFYSGKHLDRVEHNGIAVDGSGNVVIAGAMNSSSQGLNHWLGKVNGASGSVIFDYEQGGDTASTYWRAVTTGPFDEIITTGNHMSGLFGVVQILTGRFSSAGAGQWEHLFGDSDAPDDAGNAVARDSTGSLFMGGFAGTSAEGRNGILLKYGPTGILAQLTSFNGAANGDDEILDIALDSDGSIYVVGYETAAGQGENIWVRKYDANFVPVWTRTHDGGVGNDRAISVAIKDNQLVVAGYETVTGGLTKFVLRVYAK